MICSKFKYFKGHIIWLRINILIIIISIVFIMIPHEFILKKVVLNKDCLFPFLGSRFR